MTATPDHSTGSPLPSGASDLLSDVLKVLHLSSAVFLRGDFTAPWAFHSLGPDECASMLSRGARSVVLFHIVLEGRFCMALQGGESAQAGAGETVVLPYADHHVMGWPGEAEPVPLTSLLPPPPWLQMPVVRHGGGGERTRLLCGYLRCEDPFFHPFLEALPRLMHVRPATAAAAEWLQASVRYAVDEAERGRPGAANLLSRLPELLFVDCLRQYAETLPPDRTGWLAGLGDPVVGRALVLLHAEPREEWTVERLARRVAASRSVLAERFTRLLGRSPMRYLAGWRVQLAAHLLRTTPLAMGEIADRVGYASEAAFGRAFKRHLGTPPATYRQGPDEAAAAPSLA